MKLMLPPARILSLTIIPDYGGEEVERGEVVVAVNMVSVRICSPRGPFCSTGNPVSTVARRTRPRPRSSVQSAKPKGRRGAPYV